MSISLVCVVVAVLACGAGAVLGAVVAQMRARGSAAAAEERARGAAERVSLLEREVEAQRERQEQAAGEARRLEGELRAARAELDGERRLGTEKLAVLNEARETLAQQFQVMANQIFEEKSKRFAEQNQTSLGQLLEPLKSRLHEFQNKVEQVYVAEGQGRVELKAQVEQLMKLNQQLSSDANNLTKALKGESKTQGNWGELVLERILEAAGLRKGQEYETQASFTREDSSRAQPDVIVKLPEGKRLVIDAKVSLVDYNDHVNAENDGAREAACARHIGSLRGHIKGLADRRYHLLPGLETVDFVILFVPIEPAFLLAIGRDANLWTEAWQKNVLLVSPSTLLFVLRTVAHLWRQEQQTRNVQEISKKGGELYDKFAGFAADFSKVGERLGQAQASYDAALGKLAKGRGNLMRQAETLREMGVRPTKAMPADLLRMEEEHLDIAAMSENGRG